MGVKQALIILGILFVMTLGFFGYLYYEKYKMNNTPTLIDDKKGEEILDKEVKSNTGEGVEDNRKESVKEAQVILEDMAVKNTTEDKANPEEQGALAAEMLEEIGEQDNNKEVDEEERLSEAQKILEEMMNR